MNEETRNACHVMTTAVSAQDEFQTGIAAAEPQLCMNLQLARNSLLVGIALGGYCRAVQQFAVMPVSSIKPVANDHGGARSGQIRQARRNKNPQGLDGRKDHANHF